jgi:hypothetical protein
MKIIDAHPSQVNIAEHLAKLDTLTMNGKYAVFNTLKKCPLLFSGGLGKA